MDRKQLDIYGHDFIEAFLNNRLTKGEFELYRQDWIIQNSALYSEPQVDKAYLNFEPPEKPQVCPECSGFGSITIAGCSGTKNAKCPKCDGTGKVPVPSTTASNGMLKELHDACDNLNALMGTPESLCVFCHSQYYDGSGIIHKSDCVMVKVRLALKTPDSVPIPPSRTADG